MRLLLTLLALLAMTASYAETAEDWGAIKNDNRRKGEAEDTATTAEIDSPEDWGAIPAGNVGNPESYWELTLIPVEGEFVDVDYGDSPLRTREICMEQGIHRMEWALYAHKNPERVTNKYTQYRGFVCEEVKK